MRSPLAVGLAAASLLVLTACGTSQPTAEEHDEEAAAAGGPISLTDADGRTVDLPAPAQDVVVLEWQQTEMVLSLGVTPVAVADPEGYRTWDSAEELPDEAADVGLRGEPDVNAVLVADPDLIIVEQGADAEKFADQDVPVLVTTGADAADPVANMKETFTLIAQALGRDDEAVEVLAEFDQTVEDAVAAIAADPPATTEFVYADAYVQGSTVSIRPFGQGSYVGELGEAVGLTNAWEGEVDEVYGLGATDVEGLTAVGEADFYYTGTESDTWLTALEGNALWENSSFVTEDRVVPFPTATWTFGGPRSGEQIVAAFVEVATS